MSRYYHHLSIVAALAFFGLAGVWFFSPQLLLESWGLETTSAVGVIGRRVAVLMAALGILSLSLRNLSPSPARLALVRFLVLVFLGTAGLGLVELGSQTVSLGILIACLIETVLAMAYLPLMLSERHRVPKENS